jgi:hypothetical protein
MRLKPREEGSSFTITMDESSGAQTLLWWVLKEQSGTKVCNTSMDELPKNVDLSKDELYQLTIKGSFACEHPIGNNTCDSNKIEMNSDSWNAYGVDAFFEEWYDKRQGDFKAKGMMQLFGDDFKVGNKHTCTIDNDCSIVQSCDDLADHGKDDNSAAIFLVWQALQNVSDMFNRIYNNLNVAQGDSMTKVAQVAFTYHEQTKANTAAPPNPLLKDMGILGIIGAMGALIPGANPIWSVSFATAAGAIGVANSQTRHQDPSPDPQFAQSAADLGVVFGNYTNQMRTQLQDTHTNLFHDGVGIKELIRGGTYVDRTDLNIDCNDCIPKAQAWLEQLLVLKMIDYMWKWENVFVTFMPYGKIIQLDSMEQTDFTIDACYSDFKSGKNAHEDAKLTACTDWGMARLTFYNPANASTTRPDDDGSVNLLGFPPGAEADSQYNSTQALGITFQPSWAAQSAADGLMQHGLGYNVMEDLSNSITRGGDVASYFADLWNVNATTPGMFTLPVCQIRDLNYWPTFYGQSKKRRSYNDYCICYNELNDNSPYGPSFKDYASGKLQKFASTWRLEGQYACDKGTGTEPGVAGSPVQLAPRASGHSHYKPLSWP